MLGLNPRPNTAFFWEKLKFKLDVAQENLRTLRKRLCLNNKVVSIEYGSTFNGGKLGTVAEPCLVVNQRSV